MNAKQKSGIVVGILLLTGALCIHGWIALDLMNQYTVLLGEASSTEIMESKPITTGGTGSVQLKVKLAFAPKRKRSHGKSLGYTVPLTYRVRTSDGTNVVSGEVLLERNPLGQFARDESPVLHDTHFLPAFEVPGQRKLRFICEPGSFSAPDLKLDSFSVWLVKEPAEYQTRLFWMFGLVLSGGLLLLISCKLPSLKIENCRCQQIGRSPVIQWFITFCTAGLYGLFWLVFLGRDVERLTGRKTVSYSVSWGVMLLIWMGWFLSAFGPLTETVHGGISMLLNVVLTAYFSVLVLKVARAVREENGATLPSSFLLVVLSVVLMFSLPVLQRNVNRIRKLQNSEE